ncbi:MAG: MerR family transcriptional regulator [Terracidiphilus sp.]|nr:MerR family transcriptional regulator [Terracidiphilus sp.]MDR3799564.1 MerR family transcriptional regulator [Terracidiphilus sp.]
MLTVTQLARRCGLSRTALLYYESIGLMLPPPRSGGNYRSYGEADVRRLSQIRVYRDAGLKLEDVRDLLDRPGGDAALVLKRRLVEISAEIGALRAHQRAILKLLEHKALGKVKMITKEKWVSIMKACGFSDEQMHGWHAEFERSAPQEHQEFLEFLHIPAAEIKTIRQKSRSGF